MEWAVENEPEAENWVCNVNMKPLNMKFAQRAKFDCKGPPQSNECNVDDCFHLLSTTKHFVNIRSGFVTEHEVEAC